MTLKKTLLIMVIYFGELASIGCRSSPFLQSHSHAHVCVVLAVDGSSGLLGRWGPVTSFSAVRQSVWVSLTTVTKETV